MKDHVYIYICVKMLYIDTIYYLFVEVELNLWSFISLLDCLNLLLFSFELCMEFLVFITTNVLSFISILNYFHFIFYLLVQKLQFSFLECQKVSVYKYYIFDLKAKILWLTSRKEFSMMLAIKPFTSGPKLFLFLDINFFFRFFIIFFCIFFMWLILNDAYVYF